MPKAKEEAQKQITGIAMLRDESIEAVVHQGDMVLIYLKSGSVIPMQCIDETHAEMRYEDAADSIKGFGVHAPDSTEVPTKIDDYIKEEESSSEE